MNLIYFQNVFFYGPLTATPAFVPIAFPASAAIWGRLRRNRMVTKNSPVAYALTLGTSSVQILPPNPTRAGVVFYNPGPNAVAICPALNSSGAAVAAVINGAGSLTLTSGTVILMPPVAWEDANATSAWNAIANAGSTPFTAWEF